MSTAIVMIALIHRSEKRTLILSWYSPGIALIYLLTSLLLYARR
jgi:hypothetical protein